MYVAEQWSCDVLNPLASERSLVHIKGNYWVYIVILLFPCIFFSILTYCLRANGCEFHDDEVMLLIDLPI